jgi:hypothetical protein
MGPVRGNGTRPGTAILGAVCVVLLAGCGNSTAEPASSVVPPSAELREQTGPSATAADVPDSPANGAGTDTGGRSDPGAHPGAPSESDPVVQTLRKHYKALALAVNTQQADDAALTDTSTVSRQEFLPGIVKSENGLRYPGPIPFTPVSRRVLASTRQELILCVMGEGFADDPRTGRPPATESVTRVRATVIRQNGEWKVDSVFDETGSCDTVQVTPRRF